MVTKFGVNVSHDGGTTYDSIGEVDGSSNDGSDEWWHTLHMNYFENGVMITPTENTKIRVQILTHNGWPSTRLS